MIQTDDQMLLAQQCVGNLRRVLLEARKVHSQQDYTRMAEPTLLDLLKSARYIESIAVYGNGHDYISEVTDISLVATQSR